MKPPSPTALLATLALAGLTFAIAPRAALAGPVIGAAAATASSSTTALPDHTIEQSGLSLGYTPGVTDFDAYLAAGPTHAPLGPVAWTSATGDTAPYLRFDLGSVQSIDALALWVGDLFAPVQADLSVSLDDLSYTALLDNQALLPGEPLGPVAAQVLDFGAAAMARYVRLDFVCAVTATGLQNPCGIGEVAFRSAAQAVPAPATAALVLLPLALLAARPRPARAWRRGVAR